MSRSTRSSARKSQDAPAEDGGLVQEGLSVVDSDKTQKSKGGQEVQMDTSVANSQQETPGGGVNQNESEGNVGGNEVQLTENGVAEDQKTGDGEANEGKTEEQQPGEGGENQENKEGNEQTEDGKEKKPKHPIVWVSNISRHVKATDLKKLFSNHGKVVTAKIVTNGRSFFGYVCMDTFEAVDLCIKNLNDSEFEGRKISVTVDKPDKDDKSLRRKGDGFSKDPLTTVYDDSDKRSERKDYRKKIDTSQMSVDELRKEVGLCEREIDRLRTRLIEEQSRARGVIKTNRRMERELEDIDFRIRDERKKYERDREESLKKNRLDHLRLDADRVLMEREKQDLRRAREELERDLRRFIEDQQRAAVARPRGGSPHPKRFRGDDSHGEGGGSSWISEPVNPGPQRDSQGPGRGGGSQFFNSWNNQGGGGSGGGSQWRSMGSGNTGGSSQPSFFRSGGVGGQGGGSFGGSGDGGFRSGPFDTVASRKF